MGLFFDYAKNIKPFNEVDVDGQPVGDNSDTTDYTDDSSSEDNNLPAPSQQPEDNMEPDNDQQDQQPNNQDQETTDYGQEYDNNYQDDGGNPEGDSGEGDGQQNNSGSEPQSEEEVDDIKAKEEELYANLTPDQLDIKHKELKGQFLDMFDMVSELVERVGDAGTSEENIKVIEYISNNLITLRDMISDYVNDVYQTKSYIENSINYNRFLASLNAINKLLEELQVKDSK